MCDARSVQTQDGLEHERCVHRRIDRRVGTHEEKFEPFVRKHRRQAHVLGLLSEEQQSRLARCSYLSMTHKIDERATRRRQQPGLRILRHTILRPGRECRYQRITEGVLSGGHIARVRGKVCHQTAV